MQLTNVALHSVTFRIWVVCDLFGEALAVGLVLLAEWARLNRAYHTVFDSPQRRILPGGVVSDPKRPTPSLRIRSPRLEPLLALGISCEKT